MSTAAEALGLLLLAALSVGLWTVRVAVTANGRRLAAVAVAGVESLVFVLAMGSVLSSVGEPLRVLAYALGVAAGTFVGMVADERLSTGQSLVQVVLDGDGSIATAWLRARGWPATCARADGVNGAVAVLTVAVHDRVLRRLLSDLDLSAPDGFRTVERLREVRPAALPVGMHQPPGPGPSGGRTVAEHHPWASVHRRPQRPARHQRTPMHKAAGHPPGGDLHLPEGAPLGHAQLSSTRLP